MANRHGAQSLRKNTIPTEQIAYKKKIGKLDGSDVWELGLRGGLHLVVASKSGGGRAETLGVGPHRAVARYIAQKREPGLKITELSKSDDVPVDAFAHLLPRYEAATVERIAHESKRG